MLGVAVLAAALLDASAGLCFCHWGPVEQGSAPTSHGCCHGQEVPGTTAVKAAGSCCHIEAAEHQATPSVAMQLAPPAARVVPADEPFVAATLQATARVLPASSPPLFALRV
jgi:hypothetical protein